MAAELLRASEAARRLGVPTKEGDPVNKRLELDLAAGKVCPVTGDPYRKGFGIAGVLAILPRLTLPRVAYPVRAATLPSQSAPFLYQSWDGYFATSGCPRPGPPRHPLITNDTQLFRQ